MELNTYNNKRKPTSPTLQLYKNHQILRYWWWSITMETFGNYLPLRLHTLLPEGFHVRKTLYRRGTSRKTDYVFFVDADMAVVNPKRKIEEFIDPNFDITFYERFINVEIAAGSYLVKNTRWARNFLMDFSLYGDKLDDRVIGSDNAALHMFLAEELYPELKDLLRQCQSAQKLVDWGELYVYETCVRMIIGNHYELKNHVRIMKKGTGWVRDIWLADSRWNPKMDFILHGYQEKRILPFNGTFIKRAQLPWMEKAGFYKIMKSKPQLKKCKNTDYTFDFDDRFVKPMFEINPVLDDIRAEVELKKWQFAGMVPKFQEK
ncbi:unnamed protein product, partial [Mesorhabditis spiculigera]